MTLRRIATFFLLVCLLAPAAQAAELGEPFSWLPQWLLDLVEGIRDSLGSENPANANQRLGPGTVPTG